MKKISSKSIECAQTIGKRVSFQTHGSLHGESREPGNRFSAWDSGRLNGPDLDAFRDDLANITYVVFSYATPIAWVAGDRVHKVAQKFSVTTSQHQGKLYLL